MTRVPAVILLLSAIAASLTSVSQASDDGRSVKDCCLSTSPVPIPVQIVKDYKIQKPGNGCNIHAIVFLTKRKRHLCAPPEEKWVIKLRKMIDRKKRKDRKQQRVRKQKN